MHESEVDEIAMLTLQVQESYSLSVLMYAVLPIVYSSVASLNVLLVLLNSKGRLKTNSFGALFYTKLSLEIYVGGTVLATNCSGVVSIKSQQSLA